MTLKLLLVGEGGFGSLRRDAILEILASDSFELYIVDPKTSQLQNTRSTVKDSARQMVNRFSNLGDLKGMHFDFGFVAVPHNQTFDTVSSIMSFCNTILVEKPLGRNGEEFQRFVEIDSSNLFVGMNYRHLKNVIALRDEIKANNLGDLVRIDLILGHGGSPEDLNSWKMNPSLVGNGALMDPGVHLLDLFLFLLNVKFEDIESFHTTTWSGFWKTGVEEDFSVLGKIRNGPVFSISCSLVRWRTEFSVSALGTNGYAIARNRGRSDGPQLFLKGNRWSWLNGRKQIDNEHSEELGFNDNSITDETRFFLNKNYSKLVNVSEYSRTMNLYMGLSNSN